MFNIMSKSEMKSGRSALANQKFITQAAVEFAEIIVYVAGGRNGQGERQEGEEEEEGELVCQPGATWLEEEGQ